MVFSTTSHALEVLCGKQVSGSHSIGLPAQTACAVCCSWRVIWSFLCLKAQSSSGQRL